MKLLITGGAGFIGSNLIHHVIDRPEVERLVNLDCLTYAGRLENLENVVGHPKYVFEKVDLRDKAATLRVVEKHAITHVMHLAAESQSFTTSRRMKFTARSARPACSPR